MAPISSHITLLALFISSSQCYGVPSIPLSLNPRDDSTCSSGSSQCPNFPSDFCCPVSTTCIAVDSKNTAICCPSGSNCQAFEPITCDIQQQNVTAHPNNPVKTINLNNNLPSCGNQCCPGGYSCQNGSACIMNPQSPTASSSSAPSIPSSTALTFKPSPTEPAPSSSTPSSSASSNPPYPAKAIFAGFFPGLIFGILVSIICVICLGRGRKQTSISSPILQQGNCRTDFLRSPPRPERRLTVRSLFRRDTHKSSASSGEEISVFAPNLGGDHHHYGRDSTMTHKTTFTDLMNSAENRKHEQYMPQGEVTPPVPSLHRERYT